MAQFFLQKGYETEDGKLDAGKTAWFLNLAVSLVAGIGLLICLLSLYILMLSIFLLLQKNNEKLRNLLLLGYGVGQVARPYQQLTVILNAGVLLSAIGMVWLLRRLYTGVMSELWTNFKPGSLLIAIGAGLVLFVLISTLNIVIIRRKIQQIGKN